jgi:hypothetical protein
LIAYIPLVQFTGEEGQVKRELITNETDAIQVYAEKTIEKRLKVPARPITVEITIDQGERSGIKGKKNSVEDGSEMDRGTEMKKGNPLQGIPRTSAIEGA